MSDFQIAIWKIFIERYDMQDEDGYLLEVDLVNIISYKIQYLVSFLLLLLLYTVLYLQTYPEHLHDNPAHFENPLGKYITFYLIDIDY